jgi:protocatechuate 3,4-dioxygenase beta subunit
MSFWLSCLQVIFGGARLRRRSPHWQRVTAMLRSVLALILFTSAVPAAVIHGRVVDAKSCEPVKKAVVIIRHAQEPGLGAMTDLIRRKRKEDCSERWTRPAE